MIGRRGKGGLQPAGLDDVEERLVWMLCSQRSGSTWLSYMLAHAEGVVQMDEPLIGQHLGIWTSATIGGEVEAVDAKEQLFYETERGRAHYFFSDEHREDWAPALRELLLARFRGHAERLARGERPLIVVKEPNGSQGAGLAMSVLPRARVLVLARDARDVIVSQLDTFREGSWYAATFPGVRHDDSDRAGRIRAFALTWAIRAQVWRETYERHDPERRLRVRYEDLRADAGPGLAAILRWLGLPDGNAHEIADKLAFENVPKEKTGSGSFTRKAQPGEWREVLTPAEQAIVLDVCGRELEALGYETTVAQAS